MTEAQRPKRDLIKRNQALAFLAAVMLTVIQAITGRPKGPDLSHWENSYDPDVGTESTQFAIMKLTEGTTWIDPLVDAIWQGVRKVAVRGGYHYQRSGMSWSAQVMHYLNVAARYELHFHAVDLEEYGNTYDDTFFADTRRIIDAIRLSTGQRVLLYSNISTYTQFAASIKRQYADGQAWLNELDFWIAWPSSTALNPLLPAGRTTWTFWQVSWTETAYGAGAPCDLNVYNGNYDQLLAWCDATPTVPDPPKEAVVEKFEIVGPNGLNLRPAPSTSNTPLRLAPIGTMLWGVRDVDTNWINVTHYQEPGGAITPLACYAYGTVYYVKVVDYTNPEPEPVPGTNEALLDIVVTDPNTGKRYGGNGIVLPEIP